MPSMMGKAKAQQRLIDNLEDEFVKVSCPVSFSVRLFFYHLRHIYIELLRFLKYKMLVYRAGSEGVSFATRGLP